MNKKIKIARQLIKLAKKLIIGYKLVGYDILCKKVKDVLEDKKKKLNKDYFCDISVQGKRSAINKTISFHAKKKRSSKNDNYPDDIKVDIKISTDGNNCIIAAIYQVNGKKQTFNPKYKLEYIGDDQDDGFNSGNSKLFKYFDDQFKSFMTNNLEFEAYKLEEKREQREREEKEKQQQNDSLLDDNKRWSPGGYKENRFQRKPKNTNYGWSFSLEQQSEQRPYRKKREDYRDRQDRNNRKTLEELLNYNGEVDKKELEQFQKKRKDFQSR